MKAFRLYAWLIVVLVSTAAAQEPVRKGATEIMVWAGGGSGIGNSSSIQLMNAGLRVGKVLTGQHGSGWLRGNLEYAFDVVPLHLFFQDEPVANGSGVLATRRQTVYGGALSPLIFKWNLRGGKRVMPFVGIEGGVIFTAQNVPAGETALVNFASGITSGVQFLRGDHHAFSVSSHLMHISNAGIGTHNPGLNLALQFRVGYQWWK
jgi:lipid A 3-O-deacylase